MARFKTAKVDFRVTAAIFGDSENVVGRYVEADIVEPAVEATLECVAK